MTLSLSAMVGLSDVVRSPLGWRVFLGVVVLYNILQLIRISGAAIGGLDRQSHLALTPEDVVPGSYEARGEAIVRQLEEQFKCIVDLSEKNNRKLESLAVAYRGAQNFLFGSAVFAVVLVTGHLFWPEKQSSEAVVKALRSDSALIELLRGPEGPPGAPGPAGPSGLAGSQGPIGPQIGRAHV